MGIIEEKVVNAHLIYENNVETGKLLGQTISGIIQDMSGTVDPKILQTAQYVLLGAVGVVGASVILSIIKKLRTNYKFRRKISTYEKLLKECKDKKGEKECRVIELKLQGLYNSADKRDLSVMTDLEKVRKLSNKG